MVLGWGAFAGGIGKLLEKLPIQGRIERWRNKLETLRKEKQELLSGKATAEKAKKIIKINYEMEHLNQLLKNRDGE